MKKLKVLLSVFLCFALLFVNLSVFAEEQGVVPLDSQTIVLPNANVVPQTNTDVVTSEIAQEPVVSTADDANTNDVVQTQAVVGSGGYISLQGDRSDINSTVFLVNRSVPTGNSVNGVTYDQSTNTLTFNNVTDQYFLDIQGMGDVTLNLIGINTFESMGYIRADLTDSLTIKGDGSLAFNASGEGGTFSGILALNLTVESGDIKSNSMDLNIKNLFTINGGTIDLISGKIIMRDQSDFIVNNGIINIKNYYSNCMEVGNFQMNGGSLTVDDRYRNGITSYNITVDGGTLNAHAYGYNSDDKGKAIVATESITVNGGTVKSMSGNGNMTVSGLSAPTITITPYASIWTDVYQVYLPINEPRNSVSTYNGEGYVKIIANDIPIPPTGDVVYRTHVQNVGWQGWKSEGAMSGTSGQALRLEGIEIKTNGLGDNIGVEYQTHVQNIGWQGWKPNGDMSGTSGMGYRLEGIKVRLTGVDADKYDIYYQVHAQNIGWLGWAKNGESAGTESLSYRLEGINIIITPKGEDAPISNKQAFVSGDVSCTYQTHVQNVGWQGFVKDGDMSGTSGKGYRLEGIEVKMNTGYYDVGVEYQTHVQNIGWQGWKTNGEMSGTSGMSYRLEGIQLRLTGVDADKCDIYYQVHAQNYGWLGWAKNGESAGTAGFSYRLEGIKVMVIPKGGVAPSSAILPFYSK